MRFAFLQLEITPEKRRSLLDIFRIPYLRRNTLVMAFNWCVRLMMSLSKPVYT